MNWEQAGQMSSLPAGRLATEPDLSVWGIEKVFIERTRAVDFKSCVHYIEQKDCTAGLDAGGI